jgi:hypothetical protein
MFDYSDGYSCVKPKFDLRNPPDDIGDNPERWDYWAPDRSSDPITDFMAGENAAREFCADGGIELPSLFSSTLAAMRNKGVWSEVEAGFVSVIARKALFGVKPHDFDHFTPEGWSEGNRLQFHAGMTAAIADQRTAVKSKLERLLPLSIMNNIQAAVITVDHSYFFAGYATALISAASACAGH